VLPLGLKLLLLLLHLLLLLLVAVLLLLLVVAVVLEVPPLELELRVLLLWPLLRGSPAAASLPPPWPLLPLQVQLVLLLLPVPVVPGLLQPLVPLVLLLPWQEEQQWHQHQRLLGPAPQACAAAWRLQQVGQPVSVPRVSQDTLSCHRKG
jgi:hypothetical protein